MSRSLSAPPPSRPARPAFIRPRPATDALSRVDDWMLAGCVLVMASYTLEGPLRFVLGMAGIGKLLYLRDLIIELTLLIALYRGWTERKPHQGPLLVGAVLVLVHVLIGASSGESLVSLFLGYKIAAQFLYGMALGPVVRRRERDFFRLVLTCWALSVAGIVYQDNVEMLPWAGASWDTGFGAIGLTRLWWTNDGNLRYSGFARESFAAAMILGLSGLWVMARVQRWSLRAAVYAVTLAAVYYTTTKGMLQGCLLAGFWLLLPIRRSEQLWLGRLAVTVLLVVGALLPLIVYGLDIGYGDARSYPSIFFSLWDRFHTTWPISFELLESPLAYFTGNGIGAIGTPQLFWHDARRAVTPDNQFLYLYVTYGPAAIYYLYWLHRKAFGMPAEHPMAPAFIAVLLALASYGITGNLLENAYAGLLLGLIAGHAQFEACARPATRSREPA